MNRTGDGDGATVDEALGNLPPDIDIKKRETAETGERGWRKRERLGKKVAKI